MIGKLTHTSMSALSPAYDNKIVRKYSARTIEHKAENKAALAEELGWIFEPRQPILCLPCGLTDELGGELFHQVLPGILELPVNIIVRGRGSKKYGELFTSLTKNMKHRVAIIQDDEIHLRKMLAGSDMAIFFSDKEEEEFENALRYGVVPITPPRDTVENYNPVQEIGNSFVYENPTPWLCFASLVRALETFKFPYDWRTIERHAMESVDRRTVIQV